MKTTLRTDISVKEICEGFVYNEAEGKGLFGLSGKLTIQPEYQRNYIYAEEKKGYTFNVQYGNIKRNYIRKCGKSYYKRCGNVRVEVQNEEFPSQNIWDDINEQTYSDIYDQRQEEYSLNTKAPSSHTTMKPIALCDRIIRASSNKNDLVYIPFAGSGSEIISSIQNNRNYIATETKKEFIDNIIFNRLNKKELL